MLGNYPQQNSTNKQLVFLSCPRCTRKFGATLDQFAVKHSGNLTHYHLVQYICPQCNFEMFIRRLS